MELKKFFKKSRKFYLLVLLLLIFTVPVALSGCGGGGSGSGGGSTPSISGGGGGNSSAQSYVIPQVYGGVNPLSNYTVTLYEVNPNGTVSSIGQCTTNSYGSCGTFGITFTWDGNSQDTFYATASNSSGSVILLGFIGGISSSSYNVGNMSYFPLTNNMISGSVVIDENTTIAAIQSVIMSGALVSISGNTIDLSYANSAQAFTKYDDAFANYTGGSSNPTMSGVNGTLATNVQYTTEILSNAVALCVQQNNSNCSTIFSDTAAASAYYPSPSNTLESAINMVEAVDLISGADPSLHINSSDADTIGNSIFNFVITNQSFIPYTLPTLQAGTYSPSFLTTGTGNSLM